MSYAWIGILLAGVLGGSYVTPAKTIRILAWDQTWLIYCFVGMVALPLLMAGALFGGLWGAVFQSNPEVVLKVALCGAAWGFGAALFGLSIANLGFAIAFAIVAGVVTLLGSVGPLLVGAATIEQGRIAGLAVGLTLLVAGIGVCAWASILRDRSKHEPNVAPRSWRKAVLGVGIALLAGAMSAMLNTGFAYGKELILQAEERGIPPAAASMAVWVPALSAGFVINAAVVAFRITRGPGWANYRAAPFGDWVKASSLGVLWFSSIVIYSVSSLALGNLGAVHGWAVNGGAAILTSSYWGVRTGEWAGANLLSRRLALAGAALFVTAFAVLALNG
jgi:L-rhamnose-H+ transport protein